MNEHQPDPAPKKRPPESIEEWAESKRYLKWPLIVIIIAIIVLVIIISINSPENG